MGQVLTFCEKNHSIVVENRVNGVRTFDHSRMQSRQKGWPQTCGKPMACPLNFSRQIGQVADSPELLESESELST